MLYSDDSIAAFMKYKKVFLTSIPAFYKIALFNEISKRAPIHVIFISDIDSSRNKDFVKGNMMFDHTFLPKGLWSQIKAMRVFMNQNTYEEVVFGGWDSLLYWVIAFFSPKHKNSCIIESSIYESKTTGVKGLIKKIFINRLGKVYPSGFLQEELIDALNFKGERTLYGGCGILNYQPQPPYTPRNEVKNFIYVGRLISVKNLELLIHVFNKKPNLNLTIVGFGILEDELKAIANENISFTGAIDNKKLPAYYQQADVFILPSKNEPWGLVVEEALNNGTPVIVSDRVGCRKDLVDDNTGLVFHYDSEQSLSAAIDTICDVATYNKLRKGVSCLDFKDRTNRQIGSFL